MEVAVAQKYEPAPEVVQGADSPASARLGCLIGKLLFPLEIVTMRHERTDERLFIS